MITSIIRYYAGVLLNCASSQAWLDRDEATHDHGGNCVDLKCNIYYEEKMI